jgi:hypothetical protein
MRDATPGCSVCIAAPLAVVAGCTPLQAQNVSLEPGSRVRVFSAALGSRGLQGTVVALVHDTLTLWPESQTARGEFPILVHAFASHPENRL